MAHKISVLVFTFLLLTLAGCSPPADLTILVPTETQQESVPTPTVGRLRYFNEQGSFSLILPDGWKVSGPIDATGGGDLTFSLYRLGPDPVVSGGPGMSSIAILDLDAATIEEFVQGQCSTCPLAPIEDVQMGQVSAKQTVIGGGGVPLEVTWTFVEHNGKLIALAIHDPQTLKRLSDVLESVQLH